MRLPNVELKLKLKQTKQQTLSELQPLLPNDPRHYNFVQLFSFYAMIDAWEGVKKNYPLNFATGEGMDQITWRPPRARTTLVSSDKGVGRKEEVKKKKVGGGNRNEIRDNP